MPDDSYMKDTPETDRDTQVILQRLMEAYPAAVPVADLAAATLRSAIEAGPPR